MGTRSLRRRKMREKKLIIGVVIVLFILTGWGAYNLGSSDVIPVSVKSNNEQEAWWFNNKILPHGKDIFSASLPGFGEAVKNPAPVEVQPEISFSEALRSAIEFCTGVDIKDRNSLFKAEIPYLALFGSTNYQTVSAASMPNFPKFNWQKSALNGKPLVAIYHTHTSESFVPSSGESHAPGGQQGDIVIVGEALVKRLEKDGVPAIQSKAVHDYPSFMKAYSPSEETARKMLADNPSIQMIFDIHRDADSRENSTVMINGVAAARIKIIVAMGQQDLVQPHWQQNHAFAKLIDAKLNQYYPGLSKGIQLVEWRYNQHLHPRALLIEVGCQENSKEEAMRSMEMLADILAEILAEK